MTPNFQIEYLVDGKPAKKPPIDKPVIKRGLKYAWKIRLVILSSSHIREEYSLEKCA
jgi:hypothetical protein